MRTNIRDVLIVGLGPPVLLFIIGVIFPSLFEPLETRTYDLRLKMSPLAPVYLRPVIIVDIDDATLDELGDSQLWPRTHYAQVIDYLAQARMVGFYLPFYNSDRLGAGEIRFYSEYYGSTVASRLNLPPARGSEVVSEVLSSVTLDPELALAMRRHGRVFLTYWTTEGRAGQGPPPFPVNNIGRTAQGRVKLPLDIIKRTQFLTPQEGFVIRRGVRMDVPLESLRVAKGMGFGEFFPDPDGVVRTQPLLIQGKEGLYPSFALAMAMEYLGSFNQIEVVTGELIKVGAVKLIVGPGARLRYLKPKAAVKTVSLLQVFKKKIGADEFKDKVVFVGSSSESFGPLPKKGVEEQAVIFCNIIHGLSVARSPRAVSFVLTILVGVGMVFVILRYRQCFGIPAAVFGPLFYLFICFSVFQTQQVWMDMVLPLISLVLGAIAGFEYKNATEGRSSRRLATVLEKRVSPSVLKEILRQPDELLTLKTKTVTLVKAEIKNLSSLIPQYPEIANQVLEEFTTAMVEVVFAHGGTVASYTSGGLLASFGAPLPCEDHTLAAAKAAVEMRRKFSILGARLQAEGRGLLELGVVLDTDEVLVGFFKPTQDYQVLGPALALIDNLATLNRRLKTTILVTQHIQELLREKARFRVVLESGIAGPTGPVRVYELLRVGV